MNTLVIEKQTGGYFKFTLNGDTANAITSIQNDLLAVGTQLHFKTGNGANIIKEQFIYPADVTIIASGTFTFTTVAQVWDKLIDIDYFAWLGGGGTGGVDRFDDLLDTFSYTGNAGKAVVVDGSELRLVPITLYNKRLFTELEDTPSSLVPNKMLVVNPAGTAVVLQDQPEQPEQLLNSVGYFDYNDLITQTTPLNAVANVALKLTNDTEGANTSTDQNPYGVSYVWDYTTNAFNFSELEVGDTIDVRVHVQVTTTSANQKVLLSAKFGIGSVAEFTNIIYENQFKSAGLHEINFVAPFYMGSTYITDNPAELYLTTDSSATVKVDGWYVRILRKNINIITVDYTVPDATTTVKGIVRLAGDLAGTANSPTVPELANKVPNTRTVSTTSPLLGGGALSSNLTLSIQQANSVDSGYLSNVDWSTFNAKANDNAVVKLTGDQSITGKKTFDSSAGSSDAIEIISNSTGYGINLSHPSGGTAIFISNPVGVGLNVNNIGTNSFGISISNPSTGRAIDISNGGAGTGIYYSNSHTGNGIYSNNLAAGVGFYSNNASTGQGIHSINNSTGIGILSNNNLGGTGINSINSSTGNGINSLNTGSGRGIYSSNNSTGDAINIANSGSGRGIYLTNASTGNSLILNNTTAATGMPFTIQKNGTDKFTINDAGEATGVKFIKSGGTSSQFLKADGSVDSTTYQTALTNPVTGTGTTNYIPKFTGASAIGNSLIYDNGTNIEIGGGIITNKSGGTFWQSKNGATNYFIIGNDSTIAGGSVSDINYYAYSGNQIFSTGGSERMRITSGGNVGIGTISPSVKLHVVSAVGGAGNTLPTNATAIFDQTGNNLISISGGSANEAGIFMPRGTAAYYSGVFRSDTNLLFRNNDAEAMRLTTNGELLIGRTSSYGAGWQLAVEGNIYAQYEIRADLRISTGGSVTSNTNAFGAEGGFIIDNSSNSGSRSWRLGSDLSAFGDFSIGQSTTQTGSTYTERLYINPSGNVGIGTTSPTSKLHSYSTAAYVETQGISSQSDSNIITLGAGSSGSAAFESNYMGVNESGLLSSKSMRFSIYGAGGSYFKWTNNGSEQMRITSGGNVGIGTSSPSNLLSVGVANSTTGKGITIENTSGSVYARFGVINPTVDNDTYIGSMSNNNFLIYSNNTERMRITSGGSVGIGTTSPTYKLQVNGTAAAASNAEVLRLYNTLDGGLKINFANAVTNELAYITANVESAGAGTDDGVLTFGTAVNGTASERMRITSGGNVGIGTSSPDGVLTVAKSSPSSYVISSIRNLAGGVGGGVQGTQLNFYGDVGYPVNAPTSYIQSASNDGGSSGQGSLRFGNHNGTASVENMRITSGGDVFIGSTSAANVEKLGVTYNSQDRLGFVLNDTYTGGATSQIAVQFRRNGSAIGSITTTTSTTSYNIMSDYRLKEDFKDYSGLDLISKIKTYDYKWKQSEDRMYGVKAHELQEVIPYAVTGEKDAEQMQSVDYSKLVPILVQAIQEQQKQIEELKKLIK